MLKRLQQHYRARSGNYIERFDAASAEPHIQVFGLLASAFDMRLAANS